MTANTRSIDTANGVDWECVAAVNDDEVLQKNLLASPPIMAARSRLKTFSEMPSAGAAYNKGIDATTADVMVFAHQDVYLPAGWDNALAEAVGKLNALDPQWAVAGLTGVTPDGDKKGRCWSSGLKLEIGGFFDEPLKAVSIDELLIVVRRSSGLRFDEGLPGFHLYGTDIVQQAIAKGFNAYIIHAPVVHNSVPVLSLSGGFTKAYRFMQRKWREHLPLATLVTPITRNGLPLWIWKLRMSGPWSSLVRRRRHRLRHETRPDAAEIARQLGYEAAPDPRDRDA